MKIKEMLIEIVLTLAISWMLGGGPISIVYTIVLLDISPKSKLYPLLIACIGGPILIGYNILWLLCELT